jgi:hypothetical protein
MKIYTFEILTLSNKWKPVFCRSGNSTDKETGCSVIACNTARPYRTWGKDNAEKDLAYFTKFAGEGRVRIAQ